MKPWKWVFLPFLCLFSLLYVACGDVPIGTLQVAPTRQVFAVTPVAAFGQLTVVGNRVCDQNGNPMQLRGMSLFWSNTGWGGEKFYNASVVNNLADTWNAPIVRASLGVEGTGGYLESTTAAAANEERVKAVVDAAIAKGMYVIIDWHYSSAALYTSQATAFFTEMAQTYGSEPNVIFEIYNEPTSNSWSSLKSYANTVIGAIRDAGSTNLVVVGTPTWSQDVDVAAADPITAYTNVAYALHFYAGSHTQWLRDKANTAMSRGAALFVTEYGTCDASGDGNLNLTESKAWTDWMDQNQISSCNWSMNDKAETASALVVGASTTGPWPDSQLTSSGAWVKSYILAGDDGGAGNCLEAPSAPSGLVATAVSSSQIDLTWTAVTPPANCSVTYTVLRDGTEVASGLATTSYSDTGLLASTSYSYVVRAVDAAGTSADSNTASATTTQSGDGTTAPCADAITMTSGQSGNFNTTGPVCFRTSADIAGWGCSNFTDRTVAVNNVTVSCGEMPLPAKWSDGYYYFAVSAGAYSWASLYYW
jgi:endoglucanase